jgi:hypothetical protein
MIMMFIWFRVSTRKQHATKTKIAILGQKVELKTNKMECKEWC